MKGKIWKWVRKNIVYLIPNLLRMNKKIEFLQLVVLIAILVLQIKGVK